MRVRIVFFKRYVWYQHINLSTNKCINLSTVAKATLNESFHPLGVVRGGYPNFIIHFFIFNLEPHFVFFYILLSYLQTFARLAKVNNLYNSLFLKILYITL